MKIWIENGCPGGENIEIIWQCGKYYKSSIDSFMEGFSGDGRTAGIQYSDFIQRMDLAYAAADVVISRSGASSVSELCAAHKASIFVPSPNVAEDHQTHNAMALVSKDAALMVKDSEAGEKLMETACRLLEDPEKIAALEKNIAQFAKTEAAMDLAKDVYNII